MKELTLLDCHAQDAAQKPTSLRVAWLVPACLQLSRFGWTSYQVTYRDGETTFWVRVGNAPGLNRGVGQVTLDGKVLPGNEIPLLDDGRQHQAQVLMS